MIALLSKTRLQKSVLLLRQALAPLWSRMPGFLRGGNASRLTLIEPSSGVSATATISQPSAPRATHGCKEMVTDQPLVVDLREDGYSAPDATAWQYHYQALATVSAQVLRHTSHHYTQDVVTSDEVSASTIKLSTDFQYLGRVVHEALFMHNAVNQLAIFAPYQPVEKSMVQRSDMRIEASGQMQPRRQYQLLREFTYPFNNPRALGADMAVDTEHHAGTTLCLHSDIPSGSGNVFHWMIDGLPRVFLAERAGFLAGVQQVLIPPGAPAFVGEMLDHLGYHLHPDQSH